MNPDGWFDVEFHCGAVVSVVHDGAVFVDEAHGAFCGAWGSEPPAGFGVVELVVVFGDFLTA